MVRTIPSPRRRGVASLFVVCVALAAVGCGGEGGAKTFAVSGAVTFNGQPVPDGQITFRDTKAGKAFTGPIKDGKYDVKAEAGDMWVEIVASRVVPGKVDSKTNPGIDEPVSEMYIPRQYNAETKLTAKVDSSSRTFPFDLVSAKK